MREGDDNEGGSPLLGKRGWSARQESTRRTKSAEKRPANEKVLPNLKDAYTGVSVSWLQQAFALTGYEVKKKLRGCPPLRYEANNRPIYDFKEAASYLVKPKLDMEEYLQTIKPSQLPPKLQTEHWSALLKRQKWEVAAGHLWRTEDVLEVFAEAFKTIKNQMQLWPEVLEREASLTIEQRARLIQLCDDLQQDIHGKLIEQAKTQKHQSSIASLDEDEEPEEEPEGDE